jgi:hypothetical protein
MARLEVPPMTVRRFGVPLTAPTPQATAVELTRSLLYRGFGTAEAGNIVGLAFGLRPIRGGWSGREIDHLRFVREVARAASPGPSTRGLRAGGFVA